jgi:glycosyltransferase involved in cell wall biosynthesis
MELLQRTYSEARLVVVPSRAEALGQVATEAISCGTPVVSFSIGGLPDIVLENITGKLVTPFDTQELAQAIDKVLVHGKSFYTDKCRQFAIENFSFEKVSLKYQTLF